MGKSKGCAAVLLCFALTLVCLNPKRPVCIITNQRSISCVMNNYQKTCKKNNKAVYLTFVTESDHMRVQGEWGLGPGSSIVWVVYGTTVGLR